MPKRAVRILIAAGLMSLLGAAGSAQSTHDTNKPQATPPPPPPAPVQLRATVATAPVSTKYSPGTRDVCDKHPNLKQCS
ncbi:MAG TPA: hypothetical protein VKB71_01115 [Rhizomicrobium sp.]|nr:hypothetical protein [Rhizomicrobium sp.]